MNYRKHFGLGSTDLKNILNSPRTFLDGRQNNKSSSSMILGTLCHCLLLQPEKFDEFYLLYYGGSRKTSAYKELSALNKGKEIILPKELEDAKMIIDEFYGAPVLDKCHKEKEFYCNYDIDGFKVNLKCLCDAVDTKRHIIFDFKTTRDVSMWEYTLEKYKYYLQDYHYRLVYSIAHNIPIEEVRFIFLVSDSRNGYSFITQLDEETLFAASIEHRKALECYKDFCEDNNLTIEDAPFYPAKNIPAFDLRKVVTTGLKPYALHKLLDKCNQGE